MQFVVTKREGDFDVVGAALFHEWASLFRQMQLTREDTCIDWLKLNYLYHPQNELVIGQLGSQIVCACTIDYTTENTTFLPCIGNVYTWPDHRGNGYAKGMLQHVTDTKLTDAGFSNIYLWCDASMMSFYEKQGWSPFHQIDPSRWIMTKHVESGILCGWNNDDDMYARF